MSLDEMAERYRITKGQAQRVRQLERQLGDRTLRTLLTGGNERLMRPERLENLKSGRAKLKPWERERIAQVVENRQALEALSERKEVSKGNQFRKNRALRTWMLKGKEADMPYGVEGIKAKRQQQRAIRALKYLGWEADKETPYVRKVK